jgi:hypothetical protein
MNSFQVKSSVTHHEVLQEHPQQAQGFQALGEPKLPVMTVPQIIVTPPTPTDSVRLEDLLQEQYGSVTILRAPRPTLERRDSFTRLCKLGQTGYMTVPSAKALDRDIDSFTQEELEQIGIAE